MQVDIRYIRDTVDIVQVAEYLGLKLNKRFMSEQCRCPCPINDGGPRALVITPSKNRFFCFHPQCNEGGDAVMLAMKVLKIPARDAAMQLQAKFLNTTYKPDFSPQEKLSKVEQRLSWEHDEIQKLGLSPEQAQQLGLGFSTGGTMPKSILIPIRTREGDLIGYLGIPQGTEIKAPKQFYL